MRRSPARVSLLVVSMAASALRASTGWVSMTRRPVAGLDGDDADAVRDHVVQLAGDPQPLGGDCLLRGLDPHRFGVLAALLDEIAGQPGKGEHQNEEHDG